jgi:hypothetical protein
MRWDRHVAHTVATKCAYKICVGKREGKQPLRRPTRGREYNNRVEGCGLDSSGSGQGPMVGSCEHGNELWVP